MSNNIKESKKTTKKEKTGGKAETVKFLKLLKDVISETDGLYDKTKKYIVEDANFQRYFLRYSYGTDDSKEIDKAQVIADLDALQYKNENEQKVKDRINQITENYIRETEAKGSGPESESSDSNDIDFGNEAEEDLL